MIVTDILEEYHNWMLDKMKANLPEHRMYKRLLRQLDIREFVVVHPLDENRALDGKFLREDFFNEEGIDIRSMWNGESTVLEVLVAMSIRIETEITGEVGKDRIERWFWVMIENLGLNMYDDSHYNPKKVDEILDIWLDRKFLSNGKKSIFPLKTTTMDQRDIDMWYQMQLYLSENEGY